MMPETMKMSNIRAGSPKRLTVLTKEYSSKTVRCRLSRLKSVFLSARV